jgi:hypothetical protein
MELLFAILDEAEDKELAGRIRRYLRKHGITHDSVEVAAAKPKLHGGVRRKGQVANCHLNRKGSESPERLAVCLARDHRDLAAQVEAGRMSLRTAAREAGIVKARDPLRELRKWWEKADHEQRDAFLAWLDQRLKEVA